MSITNHVKISWTFCHKWACCNEFIHIVYLNAKSVMIYEDLKYLIDNNNLSPFIQCRNFCSSMRQISNTNPAQS